jgi:thioesterase DpgC
MRTGTEDVTTSWALSCPSLTGELDRDTHTFSIFWREGADLRAKLPAKLLRNDTQAAATKFIFEAERKAREQFLLAHAESVYRKLTDNCRNFVRAERLVYDAAAIFPGLTPVRELVACDADKPLKEKDGLEIDQGIFLSHILANPSTGRHLCHAMLLPRAESAEHLARFLKEGSIDLCSAAVTRMDNASILEMRNPRYLNAMDDTTADPIEIATDLAILDPETQIAVLRGGVVDNPKYAGRRLFSAGINLTPLSRKDLVPLLLSAATGL